MTPLFCYGSNGPAQLRARLGHGVATAAAFARDHIRVFRGFSRNWQGGTASLQRKKGGLVFGLVAYVNAADLDVLDQYEGVACGVYKRRSLMVDVGGDTAKAVAYVATSTVFNPPSRAYLDAIVKTVGTYWRSSNGGQVTRKDFDIQ